MKKLKVNIGKKSIILIVLIAALVFVDLITKYFAKKDVWSLIIIPNFVEINGNVNNNPGVAFGMLIPSPLIIVTTCVMLAVLVFAFICLPERFTLLKVAISLVMSGAIGNLVDRFMFSSVRDFFGLNMFGMVYCNFADFFIVIGTIIAVIDLLFLNEWAVLPLTKRAKEARAANEKEQISAEDIQNGEDDKSNGE